MKWVWSGLILLSIIVGAANGRIGAVSRAAVSGATGAVELFLLLMGTICLWSGLMRIAEYAGVTHVISRLLSPLTRRLFPDIQPESEGMQAITMNMTANLLGLGNAATPLGLQAMKYLAGEAPHKGVATDSMAMFVVVNTASIQLVPTTIAAMRIQYGSAAPFSILPCIWLSSIVTLTAGVLLAKLMARGGGGA